MSTLLQLLVLLVVLPQLSLGIQSDSLQDLDFSARDEKSKQTAWDQVLFPASHETHHAAAEGTRRALDEDYESWGDRLEKSIESFIVGVVLACCAPVVLAVNEHRCVDFFFFFKSSGHCESIILT